jgi:uncharacterized tellurite resistance protein B-like protein
MIESYNDKHIEGYEYILARSTDQQQVMDLSRLFVYYNARSTSNLLVGACTKCTKAGSDCKSNDPYTKSTKAGSDCQSNEPSPSEALPDGQRILVWWNGEDQYFPGTVTKKRDNTAIIEYDDGDTEWVDFEERSILLLSDDEGSGALPVGQRVSVWWHEYKYYFPGTITKRSTSTSFLRSKSTYFVIYDDGGTEWIDFMKRDFHLLPKEEPMEIGIGQRVIVWWKMYRRYFPGTITKKNDNTGTYFVHYDDGDQEWVDFEKRDYRLIPKEKVRDKGVSIAQAIVALSQWGVCREETWDYLVGKNGCVANVNKRPSEEAYLEAEQLKNSFPWRKPQQMKSTDLESLKHCLAEGSPIIFGLALFEGFDAAKQCGWVPMPPDDAILRESHPFHAMLCVGYTDSAQCFIVRNSWGEEWGDKGYCYIPYDYLTNPKFISKDCLGRKDMWKMKGPAGMDLSKCIWISEETPFDEVLYKEQSSETVVFTIDEAMAALCFLCSEADGVSAEEEEKLSILLKKYGINEKELHQSINEMACSNGEGLANVYDAVIQIILLHDKAEEAFLMSLEFVFADGVVSPEETDFWLRLVDDLGIDPVKAKIKFWQQRAPDSQG